MKQARNIYLHIRRNSDRGEDQEISQRKTAGYILATDAPFKN